MFCDDKYLIDNADKIKNANNVTFKDFIHNNVNLNNKISMFSQNRHKLLINMIG